MSSDGRVGLRPGRDAFWSAVGHILVYAQGIILLPLVIKVAGVATYGTYNLAVSILTIIFGVSSFGAGYRARRALPSALTGRMRGELYSPQLVFQFASLAVLAALFTLAKPAIDRTFFSGGEHYDTAAALLYLFGFAVFFQAGDFFRYGRSVNIYTAMTGIAPLLNVTGVFACWALGVRISTSMLLTVQGGVYLLCGTVVGCLGLWDSGFVPLRFTLRSLLDDMRIGYPLVLNFLTDTLLGASDRYAIALFLGVVAVGTYQPAYQLGALILFLGRISTVVLPRFLAVHFDAGDKDAANSLLEQAFRMQLIIGIPFVVGSAIMAKPLLLVLANAAVANQSAVIVPLVALGTLFYTLQSSYSQAAYVSGRTDIIFRTNLAAAVLKVSTTLLVLFFYRHLWVCGLTTLLAYALAFAYTTVLLHKTWLFRVDAITVATAIVSALAMVAVIEVAAIATGRSFDTAGGVLVSIAAGTATYFGVFALLGGFGARPRLLSN